MGICYNLYKIDKGESFDLGKVFNTHFISTTGYYDPIYLNVLYDVDILAACLKHDIDAGFWDEECKKESSYLARIWAKRILDWAGIDRVVCLSDNYAFEGLDIEYEHSVLRKHDALCDYPGQQYRETGSLYNPKIVP